MTYEEAKSAFNITTMFAELRAYVKTEALDIDSPMTRAKALAVVDGATRLEASFADPRFEVFNFIMKEMVTKVMDGQQIKKVSPTISKWIAVRRSVLSDHAIKVAR